MRKIIFILLMVTGFAGCKKAIPEKLENQSTTSALATLAAGNCFGNTWQPDQLFAAPSYGGDATGFLPISLVYNQKIYRFDPAQDKVNIYNGTAWQSISSSIPLGPNIFEGAEFYGYPNFGFTIGNKGYIGYCNEPFYIYYINFFYEYDFLTNTWAQKTNFPGAMRGGPSFFSIGNKGYVAGGRKSGGTALNDVWEYNPAIDAWEQKANMPGARYNAAGFSIGNNGYVVNGSKRVIINGSYQTENLKKLLRYNPATDAWYDQPDFPGVPRVISQAFVINGMAYAGGGLTAEGYMIDFYKYNPQSTTWTRVADFPSGRTGTPKYEAFSINSLGYVVYKENNLLKMYKYTPGYCLISGTSQ